MIYFNKINKHQNQNPKETNIYKHKYIYFMKKLI